ncbi:hypothetical protein [Chryseobacterium jejuense]|uniref:Uncharacterized protein n=1 Tax=Chryseobacterium jejuense TaxID=445960 RepID=A0A2X2VW67_CHRJE|nr:hypothetical protein [Chryseobacterium jejuense]SDJ10877.1 hypothetical protein SAMN05421542_2671 [Chryseobacterium jejuense]SQB27905.1 Uncharacterised protein [Chryseobacterium jejuense]
MNEKKLLEKKEWECYIFESNGHIELSIPTAKPTPGFDIVYILNETEKEKYLQIGIKALEDRIADMKMNFSNYEMNSWR